MNDDGFVLLFLLIFMWCVNTPVLTKDTLPCFANSSSVIFSVSIIAIWEKGINVHGYLSMGSTTVSLNMT